MKYHIQHMKMEQIDTSYPVYEDGTDRAFRNVGIQQSDAGEIPKRMHTSRFKTRRKFEIKKTFLSFQKWAKTSADYIRARIRFENIRYFNSLHVSDSHVPIIMRIIVSTRHSETSEYFKITEIYVSK